MDERRRVGADDDRHAADRVDRRLRAIARRDDEPLAPADLDQPGEDRDRDLGRALRADVDPRGCVDLGQPLRIGAEVLKLPDDRGPALLGGDEADVGDAGVKRRPAARASSSRPWAATTSARSPIDGSPPATHRQAELAAEPAERADDRRVPGDDDPRHRQHRLEEHLEGAAGQARILNRHGAVLATDLLGQRRILFLVAPGRPRRAGSATAPASRSPSPGASRAERCAAHRRRRRSPRSSRPRGRAPHPRASTLVGRSTRTTVATTYGEPFSLSSCAVRVSADEIIAEARAGPASPPTRARACTACRDGRRRGCRGARR